MGDRAFSGKDKLPDDFKSKLDAWKKKFKADWDYRRKQLVFEDANGNVFTPATTLSPPIQNTTNVTHPTMFTSPVVVINETTVAPREEEVVQADATQLIKIVGITCGAFVGLIILIVIIMKMCRRSQSKRNERISLRRPLNSEPEEHIYAEIEPLQRSNSPGGASGGSNAVVQLPSRKEKKHRGGPSFRAISTRIHKLFGQGHNDRDSVAYNKSTERTERLPLSVLEAPQPPDRNTVNGRAKKRGRAGAGLERFESSASQRPLLDGDSFASTSSDAEMRSNIYNPLLRSTENRESGPYDHLTLKREAELRASDTPSHDYFTVEGAAGNPNLSNDASDGGSRENADGNSNKNTETDYFKLENETKHEISTIMEDEEEEPVKGHDYFILEPRANTEDESLTKSADASVNDSANHSPSKTNASEESNETNNVNNTTIKEGDKPTSPKLINGNKVKPQAKPRLSKSSSTSSSSNPSSPVKETKKTIENGEEVKTDDDNKDEVYMLSKLGEAPEPPVVEDEGEEDYLRPSDVKKTADYIDVLPSPPPRTTSKQSPLKMNIGKRTSVESDV